MFRFGLSVLTILFVFFSASANAAFTTVINVPGDFSSIGDYDSIDSNTQLNLNEGGSIGAVFQAGDLDSTSNIEVNIYGGTVGGAFQARHGSTVNITGGSIGESFAAQNGSNVNVSGGIFEAESGLSMIAKDGSTLAITGGDLTNGFLRVEGTASISGGAFLYVHFHHTSAVHIFGNSFTFGGVDITDSLTPGQAFILPGEAKVLEGVLADGTPFALPKRGNSAPNAPGGEISTVSQLSTLTVTLVPEPGLIGDLDGDGFVGINDLNIVLANWNQDVPPANPLADPSNDGFVGIDDLNQVLGNWNAGTPPYNSTNSPEPGTFVCVGLLGMCLLKRVT